MNILFMGSAAFAVPSLAALAKSRHKILEVVTKPDKPAGRGRHLTPCPVAAAAKELGLSLFQPKGIRKPEIIAHFRDLSPDIIVVVAYGKILPNEILAIPPNGSVNVHASLLPHLRGAAPINWAIVNGDTKTGISTQIIKEELDAGDILMSIETKIDETETAIGLYERLAPMGAELLIKTLEAIEDGTVQKTGQDISKVTFAPIIKKEDGQIDWSLDAVAIYNRVRGFKPWPTTFTHLDGKLLKIHEAAALNTPHNSLPGTVIESSKQLSVACGRGVLYLLELQLEGKKKMSASDFIKGHKIPEGTILK